jgi:uncharacterized protein
MKRIKVITTILTESVREGALSLRIRTEYIAAHAYGRTVAAVPDIIVTLDRESAQPLTAKALRYGQRFAGVGCSAGPTSTAA